MQYNDVVLNLPVIISVGSLSAAPIFRQKKNENFDHFPYISSHIIYIKG